MPTPGTGKSIVPQTRTFDSSTHSHIIDTLPVKSPPQVRHTVVEMSDVVPTDDPDDLIVNFHESKVNAELRKIEKLSRIFLRRNIINRKRFDILNEDGEKLFQLDNFSKGSEITKLNYVLTQADGKMQLMLFTGDPGILGLSGEITARYPGSQPGYKELALGSVTQSSTCSGGLRPFCNLKTFDKGGGGVTAHYELVDKQKHNMFWPFRAWSPPRLELGRAGGGIEVLARIDERRLTVTPAVKKKMTMSASGIRRSIPSKGGIVNSLNLKRSSKESAASATATTTKRPSISLGGESLFVNNDCMIEEKDRPTHNHFCIGFKQNLDFKVKILLIGAHLLANDDYIRRDKVCTRACAVSSTIIFLVLLLVIVIGLGLYFGLKD